jgi:hypothetical protein
MNSFERGQVRILVYRDNADGVWYGTALEFNLTVDGDDKNTVLLELDRAVREYVQSARELNAVELLNQEPDPELVALWEAKINNTEDTIESPYTSFIAGRESLTYA